MNLGPLDDVPKWQDVTDQIFGGGVAPVAETFEIAEPQIWVYKEKPKRRESHHSEDPYAVTKAGVAMACGIVIFILLQIISIKTTPHELTPCIEMMDRLIKDLPARCLAEFSEMKPR